MANNFQEMMEKMVESMMAQMMERTMTNMFNSMMGQPTVSEAQVEKTVTKEATMSRAEFLALVENEPVEEVNNEPADFVVSATKQRTLVFDKTVSKDIWTINWITLKSKFPHVKYDKATHGFHWLKEYNAEFIAAAQTYTVINELTDADKAVIKKYRQDKAKARADYYNKKASE